MPMFSDLARDARLDALTFLRTLVNDPNALADNYDDDNDDSTDSTGDDTNTDTDDPTPTLDLETLHHRRLAATAILRFHVDEADDFEYDDGGDDDNDEHDTETNADDEADGDHSDDNEDPNPDDDQDEYVDDNERNGTGEDDVEHDPGEDEIDTDADPEDDHEPDNDAPDSPPAALPGPEGANERSHGWSEGVFDRAQPVVASRIDPPAPEGRTTHAPQMCMPPPPL